MEIGDVFRKAFVDHPENYTLLATLAEGIMIRNSGKPSFLGFRLFLV